MPLPRYLPEDTTIYSSIQKTKPLQEISGATVTWHLLNLNTDLQVFCMS